MKAISVKQPWAWALVTDIEGSLIGNVTILNQAGPTDHRGPLLIVSSQKPEAREHHDYFEQLIGAPIPRDDPYMQGGMILGVVDVIACLDIETYEKAITYAKHGGITLRAAIKSAETAASVRGEIIRSEDYERTQDPWAVGPYCHVYSNVRRLPPTRTTGKLGLYELGTVAGMPVDVWIDREAVFVR